MSRVLVACEESQTVTIEMRKRGIEAFSCDILPCSGNHPEWHLHCDVGDVLNDGWDMIIGFPPCTYMSRAGARWMFSGGILNEERFTLAQEAKEFFLRIYDADCDFVAVENPTPLKVVGLPEYTQVIQPYQFGHPYSKRTLLWLRGLPDLLPTNIVEDYVPYLPSNVGAGKKSGQRWSRGVAHDAKTASKTFLGVARAMADQWGCLLGECNVTK